MKKSSKHNFNDFTVAVLSNCCLRNIVNNLSQKLVACNTQHLNFIPMNLWIGWIPSSKLGNVWIWLEASC